MTRDELLLRFAGLPDDGPARRVRGVALAVALEWAALLPPGGSADLAQEQLLLAAETACTAAGALSLDVVSIGTAIPDLTRVSLSALGDDADADAVLARLCVPVVDGRRVRTFNSALADRDEA